LSPEEQRVILDRRETLKKGKDAPESFRATPGWRDDPDPEGGSDSGASFSLPEGHAGMLIGTRGEALPAASFEFFRAEIPNLGSFSLTPGAAHTDNATALFVAVDRKLPALYGIEVGPFVAYDVEHGGTIWGIHVIGIRW